MPLSTAIANAVLDHLTGKSTWTAPAAIWIGLSSTTPTGAGGNVTEPSSGSYARIQVQASEWTSAASSATENNSDQEFAQATGDWLLGVNLTHLVVYSAITAGVFLFYKALTLAKPVLNGDIARFVAGEIDIVVGGTA